MVKLDALGSVQWAWVFGGAQEDIGFDLKQSADHFYYVTGSTTSFGFGDYDNLLVRFTPDGKACLGYSIMGGSRDPDAGWTLEGITAQKIILETVEIEQEATMLQNDQSEVQEISPLGKQMGRTNVTLQSSPICK